jgi:hypothetical protein
LLKILVLGKLRPNFHQYACPFTCFFFHFGL